LKLIQDNFAMSENFHASGKTGLSVPEGSPAFYATPYRQVDVNDPVSWEAVITWWTDNYQRRERRRGREDTELHQQGLARIVQPAIKCRGSECHGIIYGPEYLLLVILERLRADAPSCPWNQNVAVIPPLHAASAAQRGRFFTRA
jgi:PNKP adenylyltransferase domain, ligase domain